MRGRCAQLRPWLVGVLLVASCGVTKRQPLSGSGGSGGVPSGDDGSADEAVGDAGHVVDGSNMVDTSHIIDASDTAVTDVTVSDGVMGDTTGPNDGDPRPALWAQVAIAEERWATHAPTCPTYHYARYYRSVFSNFWITTVQIRERRPVWRRAWHGGDAMMSPNWPNPEWTEGPDNIGTRSPGQLPNTVEELLAECKQILHADPTNLMFVFAANDQGIPTECWTRRLRCSDDCHNGIYLASFGCGELDPCLGGDCPGAGPYDYQCQQSRNCPTVTCSPLPDGTSCGSGVCTAGVCR